MIANWAWVESDFLREYDIDLSVEIETISWRKFMVLLRCLSPHSATINRLNSTEFIGQNRNQPVTVEGKANVDRAFDMIFKK